MNVWSVLAGLLVTVGASAGAVLKGGDLGLGPLPASDPTLPTPVGNLTLPVPLPPDGDDGNETEGDGNATAPAEEEPAPAAEPAPSRAAGCNEVAIEDWNEGLGQEWAEWGFTIGTGNEQLDFVIDLGGLFGMGLGSAGRAELVDPSGQVVAKVEHGGDGPLGPSAYMAESLDAPMPGLWRLSVEADGASGSYYVSVWSGCHAEAEEEEDDEEGQD